MLRTGDQIYWQQVTPHASVISAMSCNVPLATRTWRMFVVDDSSTNAEMANGANADRLKQTKTLQERDEDDKSRVVQRQSDEPLEPAEHAKPATAMTP